MSTCTQLDPRITQALSLAREYWYLIVMGIMLAIIVALWRHGR
jgi:hypothetical protein